jgi:hypothetical protein
VTRESFFSSGKMSWERDKFTVVNRQGAERRKEKERGADEKWEQKGKRGIEAAVFSLVYVSVKPQTAKCRLLNQYC